MKKKLGKYRFYLISLAVVVVIDCVLVRQIRQTETEERSVRRQEYSRIWEELQYFPIAGSETADLSFDFVDSWQADRTFGGDRQHEGCDIITSVDQRGIYPVVSMTDGTVEQLGWLKLGGYRIGIRSPGGTYYYYAHMESYAGDLSEGSEVTAGQFLGFVGDSGYGDEGTTGQFLVHLHLGIYIPDENGEDQAINPYPFLEELRDNQIMADYGEP
mgnify:CR=1 FL=1